MCDLKQTPRRVLVVDDETFVREFFVRALERAGLHCFAASCYAEAWAILQHHSIEVITLDINMPGRTGIDLLVDVRETFPDVSVIMMTAYGDADTAIKALTSGACDFLTKPVDSTKLVDHVRRGLSRFDQIAEQRHYTSELETQVQAQSCEIQHANEETVQLLIEASLYRDEETGAHIQRVGNASAIVAAAIGWSAADVQSIRLAAPMHDVGKIGIPDRILQKPGKLTPSEFQWMKSHTTIGAKLLSIGSSRELKMASEIALSHHEHWDGRGYPHGLSGTAIPPSARIVALVDVYDALTNDRVYRPAFPEIEALEIMTNAVGSQFEPSMFEAFYDCLPLIRETNETIGQCAEPALV